MLEDEAGNNRVKEAKAREDSYLEQKVREADEIARPELHRNVEPARIEARQTTQAP